MKIGVISDTHGSLHAWKLAMAGPFSDVDLILHAGDVLYHGPRNPLPGGYNASGLAEEMNRCPVPLLICRGNCDSEVDQMVLDTAIASPYVFGQFAAGRLLMIHGHQGTQGYLHEMAVRMGAQIVVRGHSHIPRLCWEDSILWVNPGSPALPKGERAIPTVALLGIGSVQIVSLADGSIVDERMWQGNDETDRRAKL